MLWACVLVYENMVGFVLQKALRLVCALVAGSPAHRRAFQELRAVKLLVSLLLACEQHLQPLCRTNTPPQPHSEPSIPEPSRGLPHSAAPLPPVATGGRGCGASGWGVDGKRVAQVAQAMQQALWALAAVVDGCPSAERDFLDCGGITDVSKYASRSLRLSLKTPHLVLLQAPKNCYSQHQSIDELKQFCHLICCSFVVHG